LALRNRSAGLGKQRDPRPRLQPRIARQAASWASYLDRIDDVDPAEIMLLPLGMETGSVIRDD
jgi:hypothetical protein